MADEAAAETASKKGSTIEEPVESQPEDEKKEDEPVPVEKTEKVKKKKSKESVSSVGSTGSKGKEKGKKKGKGKSKLAEQRGSLKFGEDEDPKKKKPKKSDDSHGKEHEHETEQDGQDFDASKHKKHTAVLFHDNDDLMWGKGVGYKPSDAVPKKGPGVTEEMETMFGPCTLLTEFKYTTWADTIVPLKNHNLVQGFNEMVMCLIELAANGGDQNLSHEDAFLAVNFLSNVRNDLGEVPPNVLALMEHIDFLTKGNPQFRHMNSCDLNEWY